LKEYFGVIVIFVLIYFILRSFFFWGFDDTDDYVNKRRSGLILYTDHRTGLQYVGGIFGGVTPRVDINGEQMRIQK